jgi:hypothetical protein
MPRRRMQAFRRQQRLLWFDSRSIDGNTIRQIAE